jgi:hypothetical protein
MVLTREEKERLVLDLLNKCTPIREIATRAGLSFREIGAIKKKEMMKKEAKEKQAQQTFASTRAYDLFLQGNTPVQVAIALNIREPEATQYYKEYWKLRQYHSLNWAYEQVKDDIGYFVKLYISAKVVRMDVEQVVKLLGIANNDLPLVEHKCERLKREADDLEAKKHNSARIFQDLSDQIATMLKRLDSIHLDCEKELAQRDQLYQKRMKIEAIVRYFENNNEEYVKIRKAVEEKVVSILSDRKMVLKLALLSLTESMRKDPDKFNAFIFCDNKSSSSTTQTRGYSQYYDTASNTQQHQYPSQDCIDVLIQEAEKLYNKLAKELEDESISDSAFSTSSLPVLSQSGEKNESHPRQTAAANQTHMHTEEHALFTQSEMDDDD